MKTLLFLTTAAAALCLSACDTIGANARSNNTGPGGVAGPGYAVYTPDVKVAPYRPGHGSGR
jgi:hypothetical protein